jgi:ubiquitin carboxyl-terminal hydrolase 40
MSSNPFAALDADFDPYDEEDAFESSSSQPTGKNVVVVEDLFGSKNASFCSGSNLVGLLNSGATCYLNSLLQVLYLTPAFRHGIFALDEAALGLLRTDSKIRVIPLEIQRLFARLQTEAATTRAVSTRALTDSFGWNESHHVYEQHDVSELLRVLLDAISQSLRGTNAEPLVRYTYGGRMRYEMKCQQCGTSRFRFEDCLDITLAVKGWSSLDKSLKHLMAPETLEGLNCEVCATKTNTQRCTRFSRTPNVLTVCLSRFQFNFNTMERYKVQDRFEFPTELDLTKYVDDTEPDVCDTFDADVECTEQKLLGRTNSNSAAMRKQHQYELYGVIIHEGGAHAGHYHAYVRDYFNQGVWSNEAISNARSRAAAREAEQARKLAQNSNSSRNNDLSDEAVQLIVSVLEQQGKKNKYSIKEDQLGSAFAEVAGTSWNKSFKNKYGPITRFLRSNGKIFKVSKKVVSLRHSPDAIAAMAVADAEDAKVEAEAAARAEQDGLNGDGDAAVSAADDDTKSDNGPVHDRSYGTRWFDFNDSDVDPIFADEIAKQFGGPNRKETAYVLLYRKKAISGKDSTAPRDAMPSPPAHIAEELQRIAQKEVEEQLKMELALDSLSVQLIHLHPDGRRQQQCIRVQGSGNVQMMKHTVSQVTGIDVSQVDLHRVNAKGVHRLNTGDDPSRRLVDVGIKSGVEVFVEQRVDENSKCLAQAEFLRRKSLWRIVALSELNAGKSDDNDHDAADTNTNTDTDTDTGTDGKESGDEKGLNCTSLATDKMKIFVEPHATFRELCVCIMAELPPTERALVSEQGGLRLKTTTGVLIDEETLDTSLEDGRVASGHTLVFDAGVLPKAGELYLRFVPVENGIATLDAEEHDIIVPHDMLISEAKVLMASQLGFDANDVRLRKAIRSKRGHMSAAGILRNEAFPMSNLNLRNNSLMYVETEQTTRKGHALLSLYIHVPDEKRMTGNDGTDWRIPRNVADDVHVNPFDIPFGELKELATCEISLTATLHDLKRTIKGMDELPHPVSSVGCIRVSKLKNNMQPGRIYREMNFRMNQLHITDGTDLLVELLPEKEELPSNSTMFRIALRNSEEKRYEHVKMLNVRRADVRDLSGLRFKIAGEVFPDAGLDARGMRIAIYYPDKFEWRELAAKSSNGLNKKKKKKKRNKKPKSNILAQLSDRTVIAVMDGSLDPQHKDNWQTAHDKVMRKALRSGNSEVTGGSGGGDEPVLMIEVDVDSD